MAAKKGKDVVKIDSSLIQTTELQDDLSGLGVKAYNQEDLEAGILKQIGDVVERQKLEQDKKFLLKNYKDVDTEINMVKNELNQISKTISGLLSQPITSVAPQLRELQAAKQRKTAQMNSLKIKQQRLSSQLKSWNDSSNVAGSSTSFRDEAFGLAGASGEVETERERLLRIGLITPFEAGLYDSSSSSSASASPSVERGALLEGVSPSPGQEYSTQASIQLTDKLSMSRIPKIKKPLATTHETTPTDEMGVAADRLEASEETAAPSSSMDREDLEFVPDLKEFMDFQSSSNESEYFTDEELGTVKSKKKIKLRELSSDGSLSSDDEESGRKRKGNGKRVSKKYNDDGNRRRYLERIREYESQKGEQDSEELPDRKLDGGYTVPGSVWYRLYKYQRTGVRWMWTLHMSKNGGIMGDEMGLGKTIQVIAFLAGLKISKLRSSVTNEEGLGPVLIVCPATVLQQWVEEFHLWWAPFRVAVLHGSGAYTGNKRRLVQEIIRDNGVLMTTYTGMRLSKDLLLSHRWEYLILDEGHKIRNPDASITLVCKQINTPHRIILSGSPMQNNLRELWSLFDFVFPGKLGTLPSFLEAFSIPITNGGYVNASELQVQTAYKCACVLRNTINPFMLRRLKKNVELDIPPLHEKVLFCCLSDYQYELYRDYVNGPSVENALRRGRMIFSSIMTLRKLCNHPDLVTNEYSELVTRQTSSRATATSTGDDEDDGEFDIITTMAKRGRKSKAKKADSVADCECESKEDVDDEETYGYWQRSGKMGVVSDLLRSWKKFGHRVLLFSQSRSMLNILERFIKQQRYTYLRMDGSTPVASRQPLVNKFNQNDSIYVFLLTTRVGGLGVNLPGANRVIVYDPDWNPSTDTQAQERAYRIGQTREVTVYRLLTSGTIEEKIYHRQIFKQFLTNRVLQDPRQRRFFKSNNLMELFTLDSSAIDSKDGTETSNIFAGTGSEIFPADASKRKRKRDEQSSSSKGKGKLKLDDGEGATAMVEETGGKKKKKKKKKKKRRPVKIEGDVIKGVASECVHERESEEREVDFEDYILQNLFKKSGVHTALHHGAIMKSSDPDFVLVEAEASKASKSATRALKESRRQCRQAGAGPGRATWTGRSGEAGAPPQHSSPRFGTSIEAQLKSGHTAMTKSQKSASSSLAKKANFGGLKCSTGSANTASSSLLSKMRDRNTVITQDGQEGGVGVAVAAHTESHANLLKEIRDFVALEGKVNGQVTTQEIESRFGSQVSFSKKAVFRRMLQDVCYFTRKDGDGIWILKEEYR